MKINQVYQIANDITTEILGEADLLEENLSNLVDVGERIFNATSYDNFVGTLVNRIGRTVFVDRVYEGAAPNIRKDAWTFGSVLMKIRGDLPEAVENPTWSLTDGETYNQDIFVKPEISAKFFNEKITFEIDRSLAEIQVRQSFDSPQQLNALFDLIYNEVRKSMTVKTDAFIQRTINYAIAATMLDDLPDGDYTQTGVKAVNLLKLYNDATASGLTQANCLNDKDFLAFAVKTINEYQSRMRAMSKLFNVEGTAKFTPYNLQHLVVHSALESSLIATLYRNSFQNEADMRLKEHETVPYWQGSGKSYDFADTSKIKVKLADETGEPTIEAGGILATLFDDEAVMIANYELRVKAHENAKADFYNYFYKQDMQNLYDPAENFVVFFVA